MTEVEVKPVEEPKKKETEPEKEKQLLEVTTKESDYIIGQFYQLITIYYSSNQLADSKIPKDANFYMAEMLKILKEFNIVEQ